MASPPYILGPISTTLICSTTGVLANFAFFCMNTTINYITMPALLVGHSKTSTTTTTPASPNPSGAATIPHLSRQWQQVYFGGHAAGPALAVAATLAHGLAASSVDDTTVKWLFGAAAGVSIAVVPYTLLVMLPTNDELHARGSGKKDGDEAKTSGLIFKWIGMSKTRANMALLGAVFEWGWDCEVAARVMVLLGGFCVARHEAMICAVFAERLLNSPFYVAM